MANTWQAVPNQPLPRGRSQEAAVVQLSHLQLTLNGPARPVVEHARSGVLVRAALQVLAGPGARLHNHHLQLRWWRRPAVYAAAAAVGGRLQRPVERCCSGRQKPGKDSKASRLKEQHVQSWQQFLTDWEGSAPSVGGCIVVLCGAAAGNVGAVLRSCAVLGVTALCVLGMDYLNREEVKKIANVSQIDRKPHWGIKLVPVPNGDATNQALSGLRAAGFHFVGLTAESSFEPDQPHQEQQKQEQQQLQTQHPKSVPEEVPLWEVDLTMPRLVLVFGRDEDDGEAFPKSVGSQLDAAATIPMQVGTNDMLNLSSTVAAVVYEWRRQLAAHPGQVSSVGRQAFSQTKLRGPAAAAAVAVAGTGVGASPPSLVAKDAYGRSCVAAAQC